MVGWGLALLALVYLVGFLAAAPLFMAPYLRIEARLSWRRTVLVTAITAGALVGIFGHLVAVTLPVGLLTG